MVNWSYLYVAVHLSHIGFESNLEREIGGRQLAFAHSFKRQAFGAFASINEKGQRFSTLHSAARLRAAWTVRKRTNIPSINLAVVRANHIAMKKADRQQDKSHCYARARSSCFRQVTSSMPTAVECLKCMSIVSMFKVVFR